MDLYSTYAFWVVLMLVLTLGLFTVCWSLAVVVRTTYAALTGGDARRVFNEMLEEW